MGFFSSIGHALGGVAKSVGSFIGDHGADLFDWGALASDVLGTRSANRQNIALANSAQTFSAQQALLNRQFQEQMSRTGYQRAVKDLQAAGLNPMLAYSNGPAPMPSGSSASGIAAHVEPVGSARAAASAAQVAMVRNQAKNVAADTTNKLAQAGLIEAQTDALRKQAQLYGQQANTESYRAGQVVAQTGLSKAQQEQVRKLLAPTIAKLRADASLSGASAESQRSSNAGLKALLNSSNPVLQGVGMLLSFTR